MPLSSPDDDSTRRSFLELLAGDPRPQPRPGSAEEAIHALRKRGLSYDEAIAQLAEAPPPLNPVFLFRKRVWGERVVREAADRMIAGFCRELVRARESHDAKMVEAICHRIEGFVRTKDVYMDYVYSESFERKVEQAWVGIFRRLNEHRTADRPTTVPSDSETDASKDALDHVGDIPEPTLRNIISGFVQSHLRGQHPDGPGLPAEFWWKGTCHRVHVKPWQVLASLWPHLSGGEARVPKQQIGQEVWGEEWDDSKITTTVNRLNNELLKLPWKVSIPRNQGVVVLKKLTE